MSEQRVLFLCTGNSARSQMAEGFLRKYGSGQFEPVCWGISNLAEVTQRYREEFVRTYDRLFALFQEEFEHYAYHSELLRAEFEKRKRRFPVLHRDGMDYLVSPASERLKRVEPGRLPHFGFYAE